MKPSVFLLSLLILISCQESSREDSIEQKIPWSSAQLDKDVLYDKILGSLVGSAIGDAMGAPTEMLNREGRQAAYGYIIGLDTPKIEPSPEGLWYEGLPPGATTDDTRWKELVVEFIVQNQAMNPKPFSEFILDQYQREADKLKALGDSDSLEVANQERRKIWLQEWATVSKAFLSEDIETYTNALHKFYGGDLLCAGILYAPVLGLPFAGNPEAAYQSTYRLAIFDQGYARDISALTAAMVAVAIDTAATQDSVLNVFQSIDPQNYFESRLMGRSSYRTYQLAEGLSEEAKKIEMFEPDQLTFVTTGMTELEAYRLQWLFERLDEQNQDLPAHAQEILLVALTAMMYSDFDFQMTMEFIVNYGRDNDTSAAVAGAVLGAFHGYEKLPDDLKIQVLRVNKENLGIDLEKLAGDLTENLLKGNA